MLPLDPEDGRHARWCVPLAAWMAAGLCARRWRAVLTPPARDAGRPCRTGADALPASPAPALRCRPSL